MLYKDSAEPTPAASAFIPGQYFGYCCCVSIQQTFISFIHSTGQGALGDASKFFGGLINEIIVILKRGLQERKVTGTETDRLLQQGKNSKVWFRQWMEMKSCRDALTLQCHRVVAQHNLTSMDWGPRLYAFDLLSST